MKKPHKYRAKSTEINGHKFSSLAEARRYKELTLLEKAGKIMLLTLQPRFLLQDGYERNSKKIRKVEYVADFQYEEQNYPWKTFKTIVEDVKGMPTETYKLKLKLLLAKYPSIVFREIRNGKVVEL